MCSRRALTTAVSLIRQLPAQGLEIDDESVDALAGQREEKVRPIQVSQLGSTLLGDLALRIPVNGRRKPELSGKLVRRASQGGTDLCGYRELDRHLRDLKPFRLPQS
jgi:hypothetical protein